MVNSTIPFQFVKPTSAHARVELRLQNRPEYVTAVTIELDSDVIILSNVFSRTLTSWEY